MEQGYKIIEEINYRAMMGEYIIYYRERVVGGIYDDRLLVKPTKSAVSYMTTATYELPYEGAKEMLFEYFTDCIDGYFCNRLYRFDSSCPDAGRKTERSGCYFRYGGYLLGTE